MRLDTGIGGLQSFDMLTGWIYPLRHGVYYILVVEGTRGRAWFLGGYGSCRSRLQSIVAVGTFMQEVLAR